MPQVTKAPKINAVQVAVGRLDRLVNELRSLNEMVETGSEPEPVNANPARPMYSLSQALESLPKEIDEQINIGLELVERIKAMII